MKNKLVFVSGIAVGYVLGIQAGKDSFEKLKVKVALLTLPWVNFGPGVGVCGRRG